MEEIFLLLSEASSVGVWTTFHLTFAGISLLWICLFFKAAPCRSVFKLYTPPYRTHPTSTLPLSHTPFQLFLYWSSQVNSSEPSPPLNHLHWPPLHSCLSLFASLLTTPRDSHIWWTLWPSPHLSLKQSLTEMSMWAWTALLLALCYYSLCPPWL